MALAYTSSAALSCGCANVSFLPVPLGKRQQRRASRLHSSSSSSGSASAPVRAQQADAAPSVERFDVSSNCVKPVFRSTFNVPQVLPKDGKLKVIFLSESNVCRSVYAEAMLNSLIKEKGLQDVLECCSKGTRDYNVGEKPDASVLEVAEDLGLNIKNHTARCFDCATDVVEYDLLLVMDKIEEQTGKPDLELREKLEALSRETMRPPPSCAAQLGDIEIAQELDKLSAKLDSVEERISPSVVDPQVQSLLSATADLWIPTITASSQARVSIAGASSNTESIMKEAPASKDMHNL